MGFCVAFIRTFLCGDNMPERSRYGQLKYVSVFKKISTKAPPRLPQSHPQTMPNLCPSDQCHCRTETGSAKRRRRSLLEKGFPGGIMRLILDCVAAGAGASRSQPWGAGETTNVISSLVSVHQPAVRRHLS